MAFDLDDEELEATRKMNGTRKKENVSEDIKILEEYLQEFQFMGSAIIKSDEIVKLIDYKQIKAIENLIKGYKREKEDNEELKRLANNKQWISPCYVAHNYIPKSKVKEKIEEFKEILKHYGEYNKLNLLEKVNVELIDAKIDVLQELMEE